MAPSLTTSASAPRTNIRRATDAALQASEERRELAERATGIGVFDWDLAGGRVIWSSEVYRLHGLPLDVPASAEAWLESLHPDDRARIQTAVDALRVTPNGESEVPRDTLIDNEYRVVLPDGMVGLWRRVAARRRHRVASPEVVAAGLTAENVEAL